MIRTPLSLLLSLAAFFVAASALDALIEPEEEPRGAARIFQHADLQPRAFHDAVENLPAETVEQVRQRLARLGVAENAARVDRRSGRFVTLLPSIPLVPGSGVGNRLRWDDVTSEQPRGRAPREEAAAVAFEAFLHSYQKELQILPEEFEAVQVTSHGDTLFQLYVPRAFDGIPIRGSYISAVINHGNLNLIGMQRWGDRPPAAKQPQISFEQATAEAERALAPLTVTGSWERASTMYIPTARDDKSGALRYHYPLVWVVKLSVEENPGRWEILVDAHSGEVLAVEDTNHYAEVKGGVLPVSNDGIAPDGVEQPGWPMPFDRITTLDGSVLYTDTGGNVVSHDRLTAHLSGRNVHINDACGPIILSGIDTIDFGSTGYNCSTPGFGGAGNTRASRTAFYELNRIMETARLQLPNNGWLRSQLTANVNINNACNAFWNGSTVNFYLAGNHNGNTCRNTGELAGVLDHEWGHGLDDNDARPWISEPSGEGIADLYAALRLNDSCIGRGFRHLKCQGYGGSYCTECRGVRDIDYLKRTRGAPHTYSWSNTYCGTSVHCIGAVYAEAVWSLWKRELTAAPYNMNPHTAHELVTYLTYIGGGATGTWFEGDPPFGGCAATGGYLNFLAADDDNGNLNDGTPHMAAIHAAFNDQEIACDLPVVQDRGCFNRPMVAPVVTAVRGDQSIELSWNAVPGALRYEVFRTEGVSGCDFGKARLGKTTGRTFTDSGLQNDREYSYVVIPARAANSCMGPASPCVSAHPAAGPRLDALPNSDSLVIHSGDGDAFLDNCESATMDFEVLNNGLGGLTNARIVSVTPSNPEVLASFPATMSPATLAEGELGTASFSLTGSGLAHGETLSLQVEFTADEMTATRFTELTITRTETDHLLHPTKTWSFESDAEGWTTVQGTFKRSSAGGGADGTTWYEQSSVSLTHQCDQITSPRMRLSATSTVTLASNYDIEGQENSGAWYDRANLGVLTSGERTHIIPDGGRLYNASGGGGSCDTGTQNGWAGSAPTWANSSWSAGALGAAGLVGQDIQLDVRYGTDSVFTGTGFQFDEVTVTDVFLEVPDTQGDSCTCSADAECDNGLSCDGAETCAGGVCVAGIAPVCDDGVGCTVDSCDEATDSCTFTPHDAACDNGLFCDGAEVCDGALGCLAASDPCAPLVCDEPADLCRATTQYAAFDLSLRVPRCTSGVGICDSGPWLDGRANLGPELNQPNTLDGCEDGPLGVYHEDESNDHLLLRTLDGGNFTEGARVRVDATVHTPVEGPNNHLDLWYAADANFPSWVKFHTFDLESGGTQTFSTEYFLPTGALQAVRANLRYGGSPSSCSEGSFDDTDDLVFAVDPAPGCLERVQVAVLDSYDDPPFFVGTSLNSWFTYTNLFESDPAQRFQAYPVTYLSSESQVDILVLPDNAPLERFLDDVDAWFAPGKTLIAVDSAASYAAFSGFLWPDAAGTSGNPDYWVHRSSTDDQEVLREDFVTRAFNLGEVLTGSNGSAVAWTSALPPDVVSLTGPNGDSSGRYAVYRDVPGKGRIILLGPYNYPSSDLVQLIRDAAYSLYTDQCTSPALFRDGFEHGDLRRWFVPGR